MAMFFLIAVGWTVSSLALTIIKVLVVNSSIKAEKFEFCTRIAEKPSPLPTVPGANCSWTPPAYPRVRWYACCSGQWEWTSESADGRATAETAGAQRGWPRGFAIGVGTEAVTCPDQGTTQLRFDITQLPVSSRVDKNNDDINTKMKSKMLSQQQAQRLKMPLVMVICISKNL